MNTFVDNIENQKTRTTNGMKARKSTNSALTDLFFKIGAMRGQNPISAFVTAYNENKELALRILFWVRDVREGAGERKLFRDIMQHIEKNDIDVAVEIIESGIIDKLGRWDDYFIFEEVSTKHAALTMYANALNEGNSLAAKWAKRKGKIASDLREFMNLTPKAYRRLVVDLTNVVETKMCAKEWDKIDFGKVPSLAASRYRNAFGKNSPVEFQKYVDGLTKGTEKVNTGAVYPYDVIKNLKPSWHGPKLSNKDIQFINAQWDALPDYMDGSSILPMIDVSGSMSTSAGGSKTLTCMDVAISLGMYIADKTKGPFKDTFLTFSTQPKLQTIRGNIADKYSQISKSEWGMSTNLHAAFDKILNHANEFKVSNDEMPETLIIFSDMQFDQCTRFDNTAFKMVKRKYKDAGYKMPRIVFWNLRDCGNVPVKFDKNDTALVSGFSPSLMKSILKAENFNPFDIMLETIMSDRYDMNLNGE